MTTRAIESNPFSRQSRGMWKLLSNLKTFVAFVLAGSTILATCWAIIWFFFPEWLAWEFWQYVVEDGKPVAKSTKSEVIRNLGLLLVGIVGLVFGVWRAWLAHRNQKSLEEGQITERFTKAVELLGSNDLAIRQGAIHALWRIAEDSPARDYARVLDVLCSYVRNHPLPGASSDNDDDDGYVPPPPPDVVTILDRISQRPEKLKSVEQRYEYYFAANDDSDKPWWGMGLIARKKSIEVRINFVGAYLANISYPGIDLENAVLDECNFSHSNLPNSNFRSASLNNANLSMARLEGSDFSNAEVRASDFTGASIDRTNFASTVLTYSNLSSTNISFSNFASAILYNVSARELAGSDVNFSNANLMSAKFHRVELHDARFNAANLTNTSLINASISSSEFLEADLSNCDLSVAAVINSMFYGAKFPNAKFNETEISGSRFDLNGLTNRMLNNCWAYVDSPPVGIIENGSSLPCLIHPKYDTVSIFNHTGFPDGASADGMSDREVQSFWTQQGWPEHIPKNYFEKKNEA